MPRSDALPPATPTTGHMSREASYIVIPIELWADKELPILAKVLVAEIESLSRKTGYCYASNEYLATFLNVTPGRISQMIKLLKDREFIVEDGRKNRFDTRGERRLFLQDSAINKLKAAFRKLNYIYNSSKEELKEDYIKPNARPRVNSKRQKSRPEEKHYPSDSLEFELAIQLVKYIRQWNPDFERPQDINKWAAAFDLMLNVKKWTYLRIDAVLRWWQSNEFWRGKGGTPGFLLGKDKNRHLWFLRFEMEMKSDAKKGKFTDGGHPRKSGDGFHGARVQSCPNS